MPNILYLPTGPCQRVYFDLRSAVTSFPLATSFTSGCRPTFPALPCPRCLFASFPPSVRPSQTTLAPSIVTFPRGHPLADFIIHFLTATSFASFPIQSPPIHGKTPSPRPSTPPRDLHPPIRNVRRGECRLNTHKWTQRGASGTPIVSPMNISRVLKLVCLYIDFISLCCCGADLRVKRGRHRQGGV